MLQPSPDGAARFDEVLNQVEASTMQWKNHCRRAQEIPLADVAALRSKLEALPPPRSWDTSAQSFTRQQRKERLLSDVAFLMSCHNGRSAREAGGGLDEVELDLQDVEDREQFYGEPPHPQTVESLGRRIHRVIVLQGSPESLRKEKLTRRCEILAKSTICRRIKGAEERLQRAADTITQWEARARDQGRCPPRQDVLVVLQALEHMHTLQNTDHQLLRASLLERSKRLYQQYEAPRSNVEYFSNDEWRITRSRETVDRWQSNFEHLGKLPNERDSSRLLRSLKDWVVTEEPEAAAEKEALIKCTEWFIDRIDYQKKSPHLYKKLSRRSPFYRIT